MARQIGPPLCPLRDAWRVRPHRPRRPHIELIARVSAHGYRMQWPMRPIGHSAGMEGTAGTGAVSWPALPSGRQCGGSEGPRPGAGSSQRGVSGKRLALVSRSLADAAASPCLDVPPSGGSRRRPQGWVASIPVREGWRGPLRSGERGFASVASSWLPFFDERMFATLGWRPDVPSGRARVGDLPRTDRPVV